tara:strand:+ start:459 stop:2084 length:1626 start_codon:yes stop_codon:yes gene_type:complete
MINENFINNEFKPTYIDHKETYIHKHHHTPAKIASHEYKKCMHEKNNEKECKEHSLRVYEKNISAQQEFINCMDNAKTALDKRLCNNTFNKKNEYSHTSAYGAYQQAYLQYCMDDELKKNIKSTCGDCEQKSKNSESSIGEDMYYNSCIKNKEKCENKYDNAKKCIDNLKTGQSETNECLQDIRFNSLYAPCYEHKGTDIGGFFGKIIDYFIGPIRKGPFYFIYFGFPVMTVIFFGGIFLTILWLFVLFMYSILGNKGSRGFPGIIIFATIDGYFKYVHSGVLLISGMIWAFLFGICILLYFFHKAFGWWPAVWVWKAIGIFPGNEDTVFNWFDRMFGCMKTSGRKALYCHNNNMWILMEDWMVSIAIDVLKIDKSRELEVRNAINAFRDLGDDDMKIAYSMKKMTEESKNKTENQGKKVGKEQTDIKEEFTLFNNNKKNKYIEENFIFDNGFDMKELDNLTNNFKKINSTIQDSKNEYNKNLDKNKEDMDEEEKGMISRKYKECMSSAKTEPDEIICEKNKCNSNAKTKNDESICEKKYN